MKRHCIAWILPTVIFAFASAFVRADEDAAFEKWENSIQKFEELDKKSPPTKGGVLFAGSSSTRMWKLEESFPGKGYVNRGFGGSQIVDSTHFAERFILPHSPRVVVLYAGDNDTAKGKSPEQVSADFTAFVKKIHGELPKTKIVFIAIKPSLARWNLYEKIAAANKLIAAQCEKSDLLTFADIAAPMLGKDGQPKKELFIKDGLHLSPAGYEIWTSVIGPLLKTDRSSVEKK